MSGKVACFSEPCSACSVDCQPRAASSLLFLVSEKSQWSCRTYRSWLLWLALAAPCSRVFHEASVFPPVLCRTMAEYEGKTLRGSWPSYFAASSSSSAGSADCCASLRNQSSCYVWSASASSSAQIRSACRRAVNCALICSPISWGK